MVEQFNSAHSEWLRHPMTNAFLKALKNQKELFVDRVTSNVSNQTVPDQQIRFYGISIKDYDTMITLLGNADAILKLNNNQTKE